MRWTRRRALGAMLAAGLQPLVGCSREGPLEKAGKKADDVIDDAGDAVEDAGDKIKEASESGSKGGS